MIRCERCGGYLWPCIEAEDELDGEGGWIWPGDLCPGCGEWPDEDEDEAEEA